MLPLLLGILGIFFQIYSGKKGVQGFWIIFLLFFMMGLAIVLYLNQKPFEPRERDYAYVGSFYAFAIWIGLGVAAVIRALTKYAKMQALPAAIAGSVLCLLVPVQMVSQTWDDHDRSKRYICRDFGYNYLTTCEPNAIIFTMGDNDTFPLWYGQEVEGYRTDVRVCNLSYLQTDWYIDQMKREAYKSAPLPISWKRTEYIQGTHEIAYVIPRTEGFEPWEISKALDWAKSDDLRTKRLPRYNVEVDNIPTNVLYLPIDSAAVVRSGVVKPENYNRIVKNLLIDLRAKTDAQGNVQVPAKNVLTKEEMIVLNMLSNNKDWSRPIYFATTVPSEQFIRLDSFLRQDGIAYRLVPYNTGVDEDMDTSDVSKNKLKVDTDILYENLMHKYRWGNMEQPGLYLDENSRRMASVFRMMFGQLGIDLIEEGKKDKAKEVFDYGLKVLPDYNLPYDYFSANEIARGYYQLGEIEKAKKIYDVLVNSSLKTLKWFSQLSPQQYGSTLNEARRELYFLQNMLPVYQSVNPEAFQTANNDFGRYMQQFQQYVNPRQGRQMGGANR
jgi:tetratricopeptide (TPR) repeat protein